MLLNVHQKGYPKPIMKKTKILVLVASTLLPLCNLLAQPNTIKAPTEAKITALLGKMTLEEKVGQMAQVAIDQTGATNYATKIFHIDTAKLRDIIVKYKAGSILNTPPGVLLSAGQWNDVVTAIDDVAQQTRLKIPVMYGLDNIHGASYVGGFTSFPQEIGQAATFNRKLVFDGSVISAYESRASGVPWSFSPVLDVAINSAWPRLWESFGEDPYLTSELGAAFVKGAQDPLGSKEKVAVSLKHYMGYSDPKWGKDRTNAWIPENYLREYFFPPFRAAVGAGARTVMVNSALINGIPGHINKQVLTDMLKTELGFTGFVVTDWQDIENIWKRDHIAKDNKEAVMLCINAGIDMSMIPYNYQEFCNDLVALVKEGKVTQARIDDAVRRILRVKYELDLFNTPVTTLASYPKFGSAEFAKAAYNTAAESITLLKNENNILPLSPAVKLLVTGPNASTMRGLNGGWTYTWQGDRTNEFTDQYNTILEAVTKKFGQANVSFQQGVVYKPRGKYWEDSIVNIEAVVSAAANAEFVLLCLGENSYTETPGNLNDMSLSQNQLVLANALIKTGKRIILVLNEGRPRVIGQIEPGIGAIIDAYLPGNYGADALADILTGDVNPSGHLPVTYPRFANSLTPYLHKYSDQIANPQGAYDYSADFNPQYPFGFGMSYTTFEYSNLSVNKTAFAPEETVMVSVTVTNTGNRDGREAVQLFISDLIASLSPDVKRLRGFDKIVLRAGESKTVQFAVPVKELAFVNTNNKRTVEQGDFKIQVASLTANFTVNKTVVF